MTRLPYAGGWAALLTKRSSSPRLALLALDVDDHALALDALGPLDDTLGDKLGAAEMHVDAMELDVALGAVHQGFVRGRQWQRVSIELGEAELLGARLTGRLDLLDSAVHLADRAEVAGEAFDGPEVRGERVITSDRRVTGLVRLPRTEGPGRFDLAHGDGIDERSGEGGRFARPEVLHVELENVPDLGVLPASRGMIASRVFVAVSRLTTSPLRVRISRGVVAVSGRFRKWTLAGRRIFRRDVDLEAIDLHVLDGGAPEIGGPEVDAEGLHDQQGRYVGASAMANREILRRAGAAAPNSVSRCRARLRFAAIR